MSAPFGMYGGYKRESTESRALGSITSDSYDYRDQAKFLSKMAGDVSYMAAYMRKMQRGIDSANENFVQQIQSLLNDFMVLLAGNGDTGLDFGDLKYVLQAIGALFGFGDGPLPINLFQAAWHFFSTYILPVSNFQEAIEMIIDGLIAGVLDLFGEVPIVGQALQQLAVIISELRDILMPLLEAVQGLFDAIGYAFDDDLGPFGDLMKALNKAFGAITEPVAEALAPLLAILATWTAPLMDGLTYIVQAVTNIINTLTNGIHDIQYYAESGFDPLQMLLDIIETLIDNGILAVLDAGNIVGTLLASVIPALDASKIVSGVFNALQIPLLDAAKIASGIFNVLRIPGLDGSKIISGSISQTFLNITNIAASIISGVLGAPQIPALDASKINSGTLAKALFPNISADMSSDLQGAIDGVINAFNKTNLVGQVVSDIPTVLGKLPTFIYNALGGNNFTAASANDANEAMKSFAKTVSDQGVLLNEIKNDLAADAGFSANITFSQPETSIFTTQVSGSYPYTLPSWFVLGTDYLDGVLSGGGGGGDGTGDIFTQGDGQNGISSRVTVNGTDYYAAAGEGSAYSLWSGQEMPSYMYQDIVYPGAAAGAQPGAGGSAGNATPSGDRVGGKCAGWNSFSVIPTSSTINFSVGTGGAGGNAGVFGFAGKKGGDGIVYLRARKALPSSFTSMGTLVLPTYKLNTGVALTNAHTAAAIWTRNPPGGGAGGHMLMIRAHTNFTHYVYLRIWYAGGVTNYEIGRVVGGVKTVFPGKTGTIPDAIPFNAFSITADSARTFTVAVNGNAFDSVNDTGSTTMMGPLYLTGGFASSDSTAPGSISQFAFMDTGTPSRISSSTIATSQGTTSTAYTNLGSIGPSVTLNVPMSGEVTIKLACEVSVGAANQSCYMGFEMSGANTVTASNAYSAFGGASRPTAGVWGTVYREFHLTGLAPGTTTFTAKYRTTANTGTWANRSIIVTPMP